MTLRTKLVTAGLAALALGALPASAASVTIDSSSTGQFGDFAPGAGGDVFGLDAGSFGVTAPLAFQNGVFGNPGLSAANLAQPADDPTAIAPDVNVLVIRNRDNDDFDGQPPANWNASWNARTSLQAIAANTEGDRAGFFLYWNEALGVNRLFFAENLNDGASAIALLFTDQSATLTGVPGAFDLNLADGVAQTGLFGEANANLAELSDYTAANFAFVDQQPTAVPVPAALPLFLSALAGLGWLGRARRG